MKKTAFLLILVLAAAMMFSAVGCGEDYIECPDFTGKKYETVSNAEQYEMFEFNAVYEQSDSDDAGVVVGQDIAPGTKTERGSTVTLRVSLGLKKSGVPDVVGQTAEFAEAALIQSGFEASVVYAPNPDVEEGKCYATSPAVGEQFAVGGTVTVYISLGSEKKLIKHINVVGLTYEQAVRKLSEVGLNVGRVTYEESDKPEGTVIAQLPEYAASVEIAEGSLVNITVSGTPED